MVEERSTLGVGVVGNKGMVGISIFLGTPDSLNRAMRMNELAYLD